MLQHFAQSITSLLSSRKVQIEGFVLFFLIFMGFQTSFAARYYVTTAGNSSNNGTAWATPKDLQSALSVALAGDEIWVAVGTYYPTTGTDRDISFIINKNIQLYGGFAGMEGSLAARVAGNVTILSGDIGTPNDNSDNTKTIVNIDGTTANGNITASCILDGFTIRDGKAFAGAGCNLSGNGNGKVCSPMISNCVFANNAASYGGAITNNGNSGTSSPMISNCVFANNTASYGGAIYNNGVGGTSSPMISNCVFANNTASYGGAISNNGNSSTSSPTITNCTFYNNTATVNGQAIYGDYNSSNTDISRTTTLTNCIIWQNSSYTGNNALAESYGKFTLKNTIVQNLGANQTAFALGTPTNCSEADPLFNARGRSSILGSKKRTTLFLLMTKCDGWLPSE